jgi:RNA polymerase sigma-70 factor, ECF subfamily
MSWEIAIHGVPSDFRSSVASESLDRQTDEALVREARKGSFAAFETLFERHRTLVFRFAYQVIPRRDDAEDIVQDVFIKAYQNLHRYRDEAKFSTWLLRITTNLSTDRLRMAQRRHTLEVQEASGALSWMLNGSREDESPTDRLDRENRAMLLREALEQLPSHHRNMIVMRDLQELDYQTIADVLETTVGGAKLRVLRARRALRDVLAPMLGEKVAASPQAEERP